MDRDDDKPKRYISFEDAMKKAATTIVNNAMQIEKRDEKTVINNVSGKSVEFIDVFILDKRIDEYKLQICVTSKNGEETCEEILLHFSPEIERTDKAIIDKIRGSNPIFVPKGSSLTVAIVSKENEPNLAEDFNKGILIYKILG